MRCYSRLGKNHAFQQTYAPLNQGYYQGYSGTIATTSFDIEGNLCNHDTFPTRAFPGGAVQWQRRGQGKTESSTCTGVHSIQNGPSVTYSCARLGPTQPHRKVYRIVDMLRDMPWEAKRLSQSVPRKFEAVVSFPPRFSSKYHRSRCLWDRFIPHNGLAGISVRSHAIRPADVWWSEALCRPYHNRFERPTRAKSPLLQSFAAVLPVRPNHG